MRLIKVPQSSIDKDMKWYEAMLAIKSTLAEYDLQERIDYNCHYMSGTKEFHILLTDGNESVASILTLRFA